MRENRAYGSEGRGPEQPGLATPGEALVDSFEAPDSV